jgi:ABC-type amino acid transport substrate-binding protein
MKNTSKTSALFILASGLICISSLFYVPGFIGKPTSVIHAQEQQAKVIRLVGTSWCPYTCDYKKHNGFISEYIESLLNKHGYQLELSILPWADAIKQSKAGKFDGLITAVKQEAPDFVFTEVPSDIQVSCFYVLPNQTWTYEGLDSLGEQKIGVIKDYAYGAPFDEWHKNLAANQAQTASQSYVSTKTDPLEDLLEQLQAQKISTFIEDSYVLSHFLYRLNTKELPIKKAGCLGENPFYLAMNPESPHASSIIALLNKALTSPKNLQLKHYIKRRYGLGRDI